MRFYFPHEALSKSEIETCFAHNNVHFLSQRKSGTTLLCNALAFYNAYRYGIDGVNFGNIEDGGIARSVGQSKTVLKGLLRYQTVTGCKALVHTHTNLPDCTPEVLICSTRHPLDYTVSAYHFFYINRNGGENISVDAALPRIVNMFCDTHIAQRETAKRTQKVVKLQYEVLISDKESSLRTVIKSIWDTCDETALSIALERSAVNKLKQFEVDQGHATIASKNALTVKHFVRSGRVGEGKEFFSNIQIQVINEMLNAAGVPTDGSFDF